MVSYEVGILFGILAGISNFAGQVLEKKAINDMPAEKRGKDMMKYLIKNATWLSGFIIMAVGGAVFMLLAQQAIGAALVPGLMASGFIVLAIGSVKILKEQLKTVEYIAIFMLIGAIALIGLSQLSIPSNMIYFTNSGFNTRIAIYSVLFALLWFGLYYAGKRVTKGKTILLALATGFPFVLNNLWMGPFSAVLGDFFGGSMDTTVWIVAIVSILIVVAANVLGMIHYQFALESGNASIVVPIQQTPQQIAPVIIYYLIYTSDLLTNLGNVAAPPSYALTMMIVAIILITISGFLLASRQTALDKIK